MDIQGLEARLAEIQARLERLSVGRTPSSGETGLLERLLDLYNERSAVERELALAKHEEAALPCEWEVPWDLGAPLPHVISSGQRTFLIYLVREYDAQWDGTYITVIDPTSIDALPIALVEFVDCDVHKFGGPNDEVFHGHPLAHKGLNGYGAYLIANSQWLAELMKINSVHHLYDPATWREAKHYMLLFHDEMFECIAESHKIEVHQGSFEEVLAIALKKVFE